MPRGRSHYRLWTDADKMKVRKLRRFGYTAAQVAKELGVKEARVTDFIRMHPDEAGPTHKIPKSARLKVEQLIKPEAKPNVAESEFIEPIPLSRLMAGR